LPIRYISKMCFVPNNDSLLLSGGGDDYLFLWDFINAKIIQKIDIKSLIEKTIKVNIIIFFLFIIYMKLFIYLFINLYIIKF